MPPRPRIVRTPRRPRVAGLTKPTARPTEQQNGASADEPKTEAVAVVVDEPAPVDAAASTTGEVTSDAEKATAEDTDQVGTDTTVIATTEVVAGTREDEAETVEVASGTATDTAATDSADRDDAADTTVIAAIRDDDGPAPTADTTEKAPSALVQTLSRHAVPLLAAACVILTGIAVLAGVQNSQLNGTPAAQNHALVDVGATAAASEQLSAAIEAVYSYDFTRLDENERAARNAITPAFADQYGQLFSDVRRQAPQQQAVVSARVARSAVKELTEDRAVVVVFIDQTATRAGAEADQQQLAAAGRLTVTGERVDGAWKIAAVTPL